MLIGQNVKRHGGLFYLTSPELEQLPIPDGPPSPGSEYEGDFVIKSSTGGYFTLRFRNGELVEVIE